jgi:hypothetical protein
VEKASGCMNVNVRIVEHQVWYVIVKQKEMIKKERRGI